MKPPAFEYVCPASIAEALEALAARDDAKVLAGGQSLIPMMNMRLARPGLLVDINRVPELAAIQDEGDTLQIGALVRHYQLETDARIKEAFPLIPAAERLIGHPAIRSRGTIGGSLSHADPAAELPVLAMLGDWEMTVASRDGGVRRIPAAEFFMSYLMTTLGPDELLTHVTVPKQRTGGSHIAEFAVRSGDFALAIAAAMVELADDGSVRSVRFALGGVSDVPWRDLDLESSLVGAMSSDALWREAGRQAAEAIDPADDIHASSSHRRQLAETLLTESLSRAAEQARERSSH